MVMTKNSILSMVSVGRKTILSLCFITLLPLAASAQTLTSANIDEVVKAMTLEEKCHMVLGRGMHFNDDAKFPGTAGSTFSVARLGIPETYCADSQQGLRMNATRAWDHNDYYPTDFVASMILASTWDREAAFKVGQGIGNEVREFGLDWILSPAMNLIRNPLCGRNHEYYSEDPYLSGTIAAGYVRGVQSEGTAACPKHFVANNQETNRNNNISQVSQRALREIYLKAFEIMVKESNPWTIMTSYNKLNGPYAVQNYELLTTIVRDEWGWKGMYVSDWNAGDDAVAAMMAGNDMLQPGQDKQYEAILAAAKNGTLPMEVLDANVKRILEYVVKTHNFKGYKYSNEPDLKAHALTVREVGADGIVLLKNGDSLNPSEGEKPLPLKGKRVALFGCTSYDWISGGSGFGGTSVGHYTVSLIEGLRTAGYEVFKPLIDAYTKHLDAEEKRLFPNGRPPFSLMPPARADEKQFTVEELNAAIEGSDVAVISLGRKSGEAADRSEADFYLKEGEKQLVKAVCDAYHAKGKKVVALLDICSPIDVASWQGQVDALVCTWQGGQESGFSVADVLSGKVNPSGKLPMTFQIKYGDAYADKNFPANVDDKTLGAMFMWGYDKDKAPKERTPEANIDFTNYEEDIYVGYRYFDSFNKPVAYPFGFGLSYTTFGYENMSVTEAGGVYTIKVDVKNTGSRAGRNVVELFVAAPDSKKQNKPEKELRNYAKTRLLQPEQTETITMQVKTEDLASFDEKASAWKTDAGVYSFLICSSASTVEAQATAKVKAWSKKVNNVMKPNVKLNLLKR